MLAVTLRNLVANKARLALITLAVTIGVSFVSSTFIFSDSLSKTFDDLATDITSGVDLEVRAIDDFGASGALTNDTLEAVAATDGVRAVGGHVESTDIVPITAEGELIGDVTLGLTWIDDADLGGFDLTAGSAPETGEFVMSASAAERHGFVVGESYRISTPTGLVDRTLSGLAVFRGGEAFEGSVTMVLHPLADAQAIFGGPAGEVDGISVAVADDTTAAAVQARLGDTLDPRLEVVSQRTLEQEQAAEFNSQISILRNVLLGFAVVSLFVSTYIIYNTFGIILSQRIREIGLLRAIGADAGHVGRSVMGEALAIGLLASVAGLVLGVGLNAGLIALFDAVGASLPDIDTIIAGRTVVLAFAIGIGVTLASALGPARQASRVAAITAMQGPADDHSTLGRRVVAGGAITAAGLALAIHGLFIASGTGLILASVGGGIAAIFLGITLASPALARPVVRIVGAPVARLGGMSGALAADNAARNPRRTANTAAALMIGLSLITTVLVVGQSVKHHISTTLDDTVSADFVVSNDFEPMGADIVASIDAVDELGAVLPVSEIEVATGGDVREAEALRLAELGDLFDLALTAGVLPEDGRGGALLSEAVAEELAVGVGDPLAVTFDNGRQATFDVEALFTDTTLLETGVILDRSTVDEVIPLPSVDWVAAGTGDGVRLAEAAAALDTVADDYPQVAVQTKAEYRQSVEQQVDQLLSIVNVMLALSIVIALIGIGLTLALSVYERTREIGLLRAVGMSSRQVRRMIRWEAALIALFGAVLGVATGLLYGWGTVTALPDTITSELAIPTTRLAVLIAASAIAGLIAAMLPARRAGRMNVLDAIAGH